MELTAHPKLKGKDKGKGEEDMYQAIVPSTTAASSGDTVTLSV